MDEVGALNVVAGCCIQMRYGGGNIELSRVMHEIHVNDEYINTVVVMMEEKMN